MSGARETHLITAVRACVADHAATGHFSGVVLIAQDGSPIVEAATGYAEPMFGVSNEITTRFDIASLTKMFTAVAIVQLAERGKLAFEDPIGQYLPDYPRPIADQITIHHLLTHTAGLGHFWNDAYRAGRSELRKVADYMTLFVHDPPCFPPGERFSYSNAGYVVLGAIIEQVSGQSYFDYLRDWVYHPASMTSTGHDELDRPDPCRAVGYTTLTWGGTPHPNGRTNNLFLYAVRGSPANGCYATAQDLLRFTTALQQHVLLSTTATDYILATKVDAGRPSVGYAYGFWVAQGNTGRVVGHGGRAFGADAFCNLYLDRGYTVIVLANADRPAAQAVVHNIEQLLIHDTD